MNDNFKLQALAAPLNIPGPVLLVIMDGVGLGREDQGNAVFRAKTPHLDRLLAEPLTTQLQAHGTAVGLPSDDDMGNSKVGHNALGAGRIVTQGAKLINEALQSKKLFQGQHWQSMRKRLLQNNGALHLLGLLSDGNVHSHIDHLFAMIDQAAQDGLKRVFVHIVLDGRDVPPTSARDYGEKLEKKLAEYHAVDDKIYRIASGGGRMQITMDRYGANWPMVERGWNTHVRGQGRFFASARQAIEQLRSEHSNIVDQDLPAFVIAENDQALAPVVDGDALVLFNFRGDRAIEISRAFDDEEFSHFDRSPRPDVMFLGIMAYDSDLGIPKHFLVEPPTISRSISEYLAKNKIPQFAIAETQKFGHVTYFWNGNQIEPFDKELETYVEIPSDNVPFDTTPRMKADQVTQRLTQALREQKYRFYRVNYANGDMVGHTGVIQAAIDAVEAVDEQLGILRTLVVDELKGALIVTADHGNSDEMYGWDAKKQDFKRDAQGQPTAKTSHTLNPVPLSIVLPEGAEARDRDPVQMRQIEKAGLANVAATLLNLLGYKAPDIYLDSLLNL